MRNGIRRVAEWTSWRVWAAVGLLAFVAPAHAQSSACTIDVALLGAESTVGRLSEMASALKKDERITSVATYQIDTMTPSVADLLTHDAVLVWTNSAVADNAKLGDNLADYVDLGGGVVVGMWVFAAPQQTQSIGGRFYTENYFCINRIPGTRVLGHATLGTIHDPDHYLMQGVTTFDGGTSSFRTVAPLHANATRIADWSSGEALVAVREDLEGKRVDLGLWPVPSTSASNGWDVSTDGWQLLANALYFTSPCSGAAGFTMCDGPIAMSAVPDPDIGCVGLRSAVDSPRDWDVAVPFSSGTGGEISNVTLWGVYRKGTAPQAQSFHVKFWRRNGDYPSVYEFEHAAIASAVPVETGFNQTVSGSPLPIYEFQLVLDPPLVAAPNRSFRMSVSRMRGNPSLCWQFARSTGSYLQIHDDGTTTTGAGTLAYSICRPGGAIGCFGFGGTVEPFSRANCFRGLGLSFLFDERLTEISTELTISGPTELHWLVFESESLEGLYTLVHESTTTPSSAGQALYSSGPIDIPIRKDRFYIIGRAWGSEMVTYYMNRPSSLPHAWPLGTMEFAYGLNQFQLSPIEPIQYDPNKRDPLDEHNIKLCFGEETLCVCDLFDTSTGRGVCDMFDVAAFQSALLAGDPRACDMDTSTGLGVCDLHDLTAFQAAFAEGCP